MGGVGGGPEDKPYLANTKHPTLYSPVLQHCQTFVILKLKLVAFPRVFLTVWSKPNRDFFYCANKNLTSKRLNLFHPQNSPDGMSPLWNQEATPRLRSTQSAPSCQTQLLPTRPRTNAAPRQCKQTKSRWWQSLPQECHTLTPGLIWC